MERNWAALPLKLRYSPLLDANYFAQLRRYIADARRFEGTTTEQLVDVKDWAEPKYLTRALEELGLQDFWLECDAGGKSVGGVDL